MRLGERHIFRQREIIADLHRKGLPTEAAEHLSALFEQTQTLHVDHRDWILKSISAPRLLTILFEEARLAQNRVTIEPDQ